MGRWVLPVPILLDPRGKPDQGHLSAISLAAGSTASGILRACMVTSQPPSVSTSSVVIVRTPAIEGSGDSNSIASTTS